MGLNVFKKKPSEARRETKRGIEIFKSILDKKLYYKDVNNKSVPVSEETTISTDASLSGDGTASDPLSVEGKQDTLVSGTNIKTVNGTSVLGSGDLAVGGGDSGYHMQLLPGGPYYGGIHQANTNAAGTNYANQTFANRMSYFPFIPNQDFTSTEMRFNCNQAGAGDEARLCIYSHDGVNAPQNLLYESSAVDMSTTGYKTINVTRTWTKGEVYWLGIHTKNGLSRILGMGTNVSDSLIIGLLNSARFKMWAQTGQTFANGAPATAFPNSFRYDVYMVEFK
jgi:hypothetical protein